MDGWMGVPRAHSQTDGCADVAASSDVQIAWKQCCHVRTCGDGIGCDVGAKLGESKCKGNNEHAESSWSVGVRA